MSPRREDGYALVLAVAAVAAFAYVAFQVIAANRGEIAAVSARTEHAQLAAAADAGIMIAIHGLATDDRAARWSIDGRPRSADFAGADLTIVVQDERGKAPLNGLTDGQVKALFEGAGATGDRLDALVDEFRAWQEQGFEDPQAGPVDQAAPETAPGLQPRHGAYETVGELMGLRDMDAALFARVAPAVTVFFEESGPFAIESAQPLAIQAMGGQAMGVQDVQEGTDEEIADDHLLGRTLTVDVVARSPRGGRAHRMAIIELTSSKAQPYWVRYVE